MIKLIKNMYSQIKLTVKGYSKHFEEISSSKGLNENVYNSNIETTSDDTFFCSKAGVFQGESLSPFLFSMFINDIGDYINSAHEVGVPLESCLLSMVLFADDMAVFSLTREGLQNGIDCLNEYCVRWGLSVNVEKTKCVAFKKGGKIACLDQWTYNGNAIETVNQFKYLGFVLGSSGTFNKGIDMILTKSQRALFSLKTIFHRNPEMDIRTKINLFNTLVIPVLTYGCEVWGFCKAEQLERFYLGFFKSILCVRKTIPSSFIYNELGIFPLSITRQIRLIKYWLRITKMSNKNPVKIVYNELMKIQESNENVQNWTSLLKDLLFKNGFGNVWIEQNVSDPKSFLIAFETRIKDIFVQNNNTLIQDVSEHRLFRHIDHPHILASYLSFISEDYVRIALSRLRLGSHNLMIERGRWEKPKRLFRNRLCEVCNEIEDEYHVIFKCSRYSDIRGKYIGKSIVKKPSMFKLINLIESEDYVVVRKLGLFCHFAFKRYDSSFI